MRASLLGLRARDRVTEVEGIVTAVSVHLTGEEKVLIEPGLEKGVLMSPIWVDVHRLALSSNKTKFELSNVEGSNLKESTPGQVSDA